MGKLSLGSVLAGAGRFVGGYADGQADYRRGQREEEEFRARREEDAYRKSERQRIEGERMALANAVRPATIEEGAGGAIRPATMDDRDVGQPGEAPLALGASLRNTATGQTFTDRAAADASVTDYNAPAAQDKRLSLAMAKTDPLKARAFDRENEQIAAQRREAARKARDEGLIDAARAARSGNPQEVFNAFNATGTMRLKGVPEVKEETRELPGYGKVRTYTYTGTLVGPDGRETQGSINSHDLNMRTIGYEKELEIGRKGVEAESKHDARVQQLEIAAKRAEAAGLVAEARVLRAQAQGNGEAKLSGQERMRLTSLFSESGRNMREVSKRLNTLQSDRQFMRKAATPNTDESRLLASVRDEYGQHKSEYEMWQGMLAEPGGKKPALADAKPSGAAQAAPLAMPKAKSELQKGKVYNTSRGPARWNGTAFEAQ